MPTTTVVSLKRHSDGSITISAAPDVVLISTAFLANLDGWNANLRNDVLTLRAIGRTVAYRLRPVDLKRDYRMADKVYDDAA